MSLYLKKNESTKRCERVSSVCVCFHIYEHSEVHIPKGTAYYRNTTLSMFFVKKCHRKDFNFKAFCGLSQKLFFEMSYI